ncbi:MAG: hypothetical protein M0Q38_10080 [Bacteroidales bacterium]|jgi:hypothetical protein|nr:hypothetical protein [Bacteroidales bacterium]
MEKDFNAELDDLIDEALRQPPDIALPRDFTDRMVAVVIQQQTWKESLTDFLYKCLIAIGALTVFGVVFYFVTIKSTDLLIAYLRQNWKFIVTMIIIGLFVLFTDQFILKYLFRNSKSIA